MDRFTMVELAQLLVTSVGIVASAVALRDASRLHRWVIAQRIGNGRRLVSTGHLVGEALRAGWQAMLFMHAIISFEALPTPPTSMPETYLDWLVVRKFTVLLGSLFCTMLTLWDLYIRRELGRLTDDEPRSPTW